MFASNQVESVNKFTIDFLIKNHPEFVDHYNRFVKNHIDEFEQKRQEALAQAERRKIRGVQLKVLGVLVGVIIFFLVKDVHIGTIIAVMIFLWSCNIALV